MKLVHGIRMRAPLIFLACASLLAQSALSATATVTLPPEPMSIAQAEAAGRARALVESLPRGVVRHRAATHLAYRLMMRGDCPRALLVMNRELRHVADPIAVGGLITGALTGRDARCMAWVAARADAVIRIRSLREDRRSELRLRGQALFELVGQMERAAGMPPADAETLAIVPEALRYRQIALGDTILHVGISDAPTRLETLLVDRLWHYRNTPLQLRLARALARRAASEPGFFSRSGWVEVALALLAGGDREAALQILADARVRFMSLAGLEAEAALRAGDYERAASIFAANEWGTKSKSVYRLFETRPDLLIPFIEGQSVFGASSSPALDLVSLSEALDQAGHADGARRAAIAALARFSANGPGQNRRAQAFARTGDFEAANRLLADAMERPGREDPAHFRMAIVRGAALAGNLAQVDRAVAEAPAGLRDLLLVGALAAIARTRSPLFHALEDRLDSRIAEAPGLTVSTDALVAFAEAGMRTALLVSLAERLEPGREGAAAAILIAEAARRHGHGEAAAAIARAAEALLPRGPQADAELVELAGFYWRLGMTGKAISLAMRVSHPVGRVDAMTRALIPTRGESRAKLSFQTF
jgi:hypothetical protein